MFVNEKEYSFLSKFFPLLKSECGGLRFLPDAQKDKGWEKTIFSKYAPFINIFGLSCITCHEGDPYSDRFLIRADSSEKNYFLPGDKGYKTVKHKNLLVFESVGEAEKTGFRNKD
ncbi:MAG: hypothetical protein PHO00_03965 [bacterium]|nr:hypothetical protein [bacterium]